MYSVNWKIKQNTEKRAIGIRNWIFFLCWVVFRLLFFPLFLFVETTTFFKDFYCFFVRSIRIFGASRKCVKMCGCIKTVPLWRVYMSFCFILCAENVFRLPYSLSIHVFVYILVSFVFPPPSMSAWSLNNNGSKHWNWVGNCIAFFSNYWYSCCRMLLCAVYYYFVIRFLPKEIFFISTLTKRGISHFE